MTYKPVDTATTMVVGPCIDATNFKTLEEAIAYNAAGMDVSLIVEKTDGTTAVTAITLTTGGTSDWTHKDGGYYEVEITAAQNVEEGIAFVRGVCTGVLPFESPRYDIVPTHLYDSLIKGTDKLEVDAVQLSNSAQSLLDLKDFADAGYDPSAHRTQAQIKATDDIDLSATQKTSVNDQVVDVMKTDTVAEPSQGAPPATPTMEEIQAYLYFWLRNKTVTTADETAMYDDAGTTKLMKAALTDSGTTFTKAEYISGT